MTSGFVKEGSEMADKISKKEKRECSDNKGKKG